MNFCIAYSPNWLQYIQIEIFALVNTNRHVKRIYLMSDAGGKPEEKFLNYIWFEYGAEVIFIDLEREFLSTIHTPASIGRFTKYTLYRLLIPQVIAEPRVLYLDADTIVNGSLQEFYYMGLKDFEVAGVQDVGMLEPQLKAIGKKYGEPYVNGGVLLMNLDLIRQKGLSHVWIQQINTRPTCCFDQDVINATCKVRLVGNMYNSSLSTGFAPLEKIKIAHFAGPLHKKGWSGPYSPMHSIWKHWEERYRAEVEL